MSQRKQRRISQIQQQIDDLNRQLNILMGIRKRSLRAIGTTPTGARTFGEMRRRGRIFGCLPPAAAAECESACGLTDRDGPMLGGYTTKWCRLCYWDFEEEVVWATVTLNLAAAASVVIMASIVSNVSHVNFQIQRPLGTNVTDQAASARFAKTTTCGDLEPFLIHLGACETLVAGNYTWSLALLGACHLYAAWMKAHEITCA